MVADNACHFAYGLLIQKTVWIQNQRERCRYSIQVGVMASPESHIHGAGDYFDVRKLISQEGNRAVRAGVIEDANLNALGK